MTEHQGEYIAGGFQSQNHTMTPNDLFDVHMQNMSNPCLRIVLSITRQTVGYHREKVKFSIAKIMSMTGMSRNSVTKGADEAEAMGFITRTNSESGKSAEWELVIKSTPSKSEPPQSVTTTPSIREPLPPQSVRDSIAAKESIKESIKETDHPLFSKEANQKVQETESMINEVEKALGILDCVNMEGSGKWEKAIRYLIKMKKEKGWSFQVLWLYVNSDDVKYEKDKLSYGSLMKDPHALLKAWMPRAHAVQSEQIPDTKLYHKKYIPEASDEYIPNPNK